MAEGASKAFIFFFIIGSKLIDLGQKVNKQKMEKICNIKWSNRGVKGRGNEADFFTIDSN